MPVTEREKEHDDDQDNTLTRTGTSLSTSMDPKIEQCALEHKITWNHATAAHKVAEFLTPNDTSSSSSDREITLVLQQLEEAFAHQILYIMGKEEMHII